jgi:cell division protein FtsI/penicillin-binding protein 2
MINPAAMLRFVSAIANDGVAADQSLLMKSSSGSERIISSSTAETVARMMNYNVYYTYGEDNYPGLELYAKSGTAEVGGGADPHALFVGFIRDPDHPYAFVVIVRERRLRKQSGRQSGKRGPAGGSEQIRRVIPALFNRYISSSWER